MSRTLNQAFKKGIYVNGLSIADHTWGELFASMAARHRDRVAIRPSTTYGELALRVERVAQNLVDAGVRKGTRVALMITNRPEWIIAAFAISRAGGVLVPVSTLASASERDFVLDDSGAEMLIAQERVKNRALLEALPALARVFVLGDDSWKKLESRTAQTRLPDVSSTDEAMIIYTSGTTARPKGVVHAHRAPVTQSHHFASYLRLVPDDRLFTLQPFFWTAGIAVSLGGALVSGASLILQEVFDAEEALSLIERERATAIRAWPHQEKAMADHASARSRDLASITKLNFSSPLARIVGLEADRWGTQGGFGLTETFTVVADLPADAPAELRMSTNGLPLPGATVRIIDGEIAVKASTMMLRYQGVDPRETFDAEGFFRTGDGGFIDGDGYLHWTGRTSSMIKTGGANVSPLEIERLLSDHPGIKDARAIGVPHPTLGEVVILCVVPGAGALDLDSLRAQLKSALAVYKVPKEILVFEAADVAWTGSQKIQLAPLREAALRRLKESRVQIAGFVYGQ
jgi:fatty-acyl-CoA synthase